jgi:hypothetical protein
MSDASVGSGWHFGAVWDTPRYQVYGLAALGVGGSGVEHTALPDLRIQNRLL